MLGRLNCGCRAHEAFASAVLQEIGACDQLAGGTSSEKSKSASEQHEKGKDEDPVSLGIKTSKVDP